MMNTSKTQRLLEALKSGEELTSNQISSRFNIVHPPSVVRNLRFAGYAIYSNEKKNSKGKTVSRFRLGTPTREVIGAGYKALSQGLV